MRLRPEAEICAPSSPSPARATSRSDRLAEVDTTAELTAARAGLGDIAAVELATRGQVTLNNLAARLRDGYDILYLVAHGMLVDGEPWLFLEKEDGTADLVPGRELADAHPGAGRPPPAGRARLLPERRGPATNQSAQDRRRARRPGPAAG